jgi:hypothetical protein
MPFGWYRAGQGVITMGLAERRAAQEFESKKFPELKKELQKAAGFPVAVEVKWDQLTKEGQSHLYDEAWTKVYFTPLIAAFKAITVDDMGKTALKGSLKKVLIGNSTGTYSAGGWAKFASGQLTLDHEPTTNVDDVKDRSDHLRKALEAAL